MTMTMMVRRAVHAQMRESVWTAVLLCWMGHAALPSVHAQQFDREARQNASATFIGTVVQTDAVTFPEAPRSGNTLLTRIDQLLDKPPTIPIKSGDEITVFVPEPAAFPEGPQAVFYADGWILGKGVALRVVAHTLVKPEEAGAVRTQALQEFQQTQQALAAQQLAARIESADLVVLAKLTSVRAATEGERFITEHDPQWQDALVVVRNVVKGATEGEQLIVRFPGSTDVASYRIPKLKPGDEQIIFAAKDRFSGLPPAQLAGRAVATYIIRSPQEVRPKEDFERIRQAAQRK
mgnify:FL=1